jgi:hypothetical protein
MPLVFRSVKGSRLTSTEVDANFQYLADQITDAIAAAPEAVNIDHFTITGTLLTIVMTNGDNHGPFVLPVATWRWTGEYAAGTTYLPGDLFTESGNVYFVRVQHVAPDPFNAALITVDGAAYILILSKSSQPYDIGGFFADRIESGADVIYIHIVARDIIIPLNFRDSQAYLQIATTTSPISLPIYVNNDIVGQITFTPGVDTNGLGGQFGTFTQTDPGSGDLVLAARDVVSIALPYEDDATAAGLAFTITSTTPGV